MCLRFIGKRGLKTSKVGCVTPGTVFLDEDGKKKQYIFCPLNKRLVIQEYSNGSNSKNKKLLHTVL